MRNDFEGGFSLVELMVALVIGLLVVFGASSIFVSMKGSFNRLGGLADRQEAIRYISDSIMMDVRVSDEVCHDPDCPDVVRIKIPKRTHGTLYCNTDEAYYVFYRVIDDPFSSYEALGVAKDCDASDGISVDIGDYEPIVSRVVDFSVQAAGSNRLYLVSLTLPPLDGGSGGGNVSYQFHAARRTPLVGP